MENKPTAKIVIPRKSPEEETPWKWRKSKEGYLMPIPARERIKPNKYKPTLGKTLKSPNCFNVGPIQVVCKSCMWQYSCVTQVR